VDGAAERIAAARLGGGPRAALPEGLRPRDEAAAYRLQARVHERLARTLGPPVGYKIGCTTPVMQAYLRIPNPCAGAILQRTVHRGHAALAHRGFVRVGVECEIAVQLGADLHAAPPGPDREALRGAVAALMTAIEIVDDRWVDYPSVDTPSLIADDFFGAGCVLGPPLEDWRTLDLASLGGAMRVNGREVGRGTGADILGHPLEALAWLAGHLTGRGEGLRAGEIVLLGSLVRTEWLAPGDEVEIEIERLGRAAARFG